MIISKATEPRGDSSNSMTFSPKSLKKKTSLVCALLNGGKRPKQHQWHGNKRNEPKIKTDIGVHKEILPRSG